MKQYLTTQLKEFNALEIGSKICLIGSWVTSAGVALLIGSSAVTVGYWLVDSEPSPIIKKSLAVGLGLAVGGGLFTCGAAMEDDRQTELMSEAFYKKLADRIIAKEASPCPNCKYFNNDCDLYCAVNPAIACKSEADNCPDFESKDVN